MIITLTTDFSDSGGFVAQVKARLLELFGETVTIIDVTHSITPFQAVEAAYIVRTALSRFPENTIHIVVVDPGVGTDRAIVAAKLGDSYIISPDNEALSLVELTHCIRIDPKRVSYIRTHTFDAYGIMAPAAYRLYEKGIDSLGERYTPKTQKLFPLKRGNTIKGRIVYIDRFGNCISNIEGRCLQNLNRIKIKQLTFKTVNGSYMQNLRKPFALINSAGFLEFAVGKGSFHKLYGIEYLDEVDVILDR